MKFLIVDDSRAMLAILRRVVENAGYKDAELRTAQTGQEALLVLQEFTPDLVLTDWHMPNMSGIEMLQVLRQIGKPLRIGFITTEAHPDRLEEARRNGATFVLNKPFRDDELIAAIRSALATPLVTEDDSKVVQHLTLTDLLKETLKKIPFRLVESPMTPDNLTESNLLALYSATGTNGVYAVAVMDSLAVTMVGCGALGMQPDVVRPMMTLGKPSEEVQQQSAEFLEKAARIIKADKGVDVAMSKQSLVNRDFAKLQSLLYHNHGHSGFRISIPGYGDGRLGFMIV